MKNYNQFLAEEAIRNNVKGLDKEGLHDYINKHSNLLNDEQVKGILENPHVKSVDGVRRLTNIAGSIDKKGLGILTIHAMSEPDKHTRSSMAYQLVNNGNLTDEHLKHIVKSSLSPVSTESEFDDHLANKIYHKATNKTEIESRITTMRNNFKK